MVTSKDTRIPTPKARQRAFRSALRDVATAVTMLEQANAELERDKTPIDVEAEDRLMAVANRLYGLHEDGRYVGIDYGDDPSKSVANLLGKVARASAAKEALDEQDRSHKARLERIGFKLVRDCMGKLYILDPGSDELLAVGLDEKTIEHEIQYLESDKGAPSSASADGDTPLAVRRAVRRVVKAYRDGGQDCTVEFDEALAALQKAVRAGGAA